MKTKTKTKAFTLIELLVVISILGILMGIVGPKVIDLLSGSEKTKMQAILRGWVTQLHQYKSHYGYFPPFLSNAEEGTPIILSEQENYEKFMISLKGKTMSDNGAWLEVEIGDPQNPKRKEFHSFSDDEFYIPDNPLSFLRTESPHLKGSASQKLYILTDQDGDGVIKMDETLVDEILESLSSDFSTNEIQNIDREIFRMVYDKIIILLLEDEDLDVRNVYSWNVEKFFE
jgi:prepilin-type N-terminal cleavage/methylation domain-containing protein